MKNLNEFTDNFFYFLPIHVYKLYLKKSSWCGCGSTLNTSPQFSVVSDSFCDRKCEGNTNEMCGGYFYFSVYAACLYKKNKN